MNETAAAAFVHHGQTGPIIRLALRNALLSVVTLSFYRFWGKTKVRAQLWGDTAVWGEPLEYAGLGKELLIGFLIVAAVVFAPLYSAWHMGTAMTAAGDPRGGLIVLAVFAIGAFLMGIGLYRSRRYLLTRTIWRGLRGGQDGSSFKYALLFILHIVLQPFTLGWSNPATALAKDRYMLNNARIGDARFRCTAKAGGLYGKFLTLWISMIPFLIVVVSGQALLGAYVQKNAEAMAYVGFASWALSLIAGAAFILPAYVWYKAAYWRHVAAHTTLDGIGFAFNMPAKKLFRLVAGNMLISVLTLGVLRPWASLRSLRAICTHLSMERMPDPARLTQAQRVAIAGGEGFSAVLEGVGEF